MKELKRTDLYALIRTETSVRIQDFRTMEERVVDCERSVDHLLDMDRDTFDDWALELFNT